MKKIKSKNAPQGKIIAQKKETKIEEPLKLSIKDFETISLRNQNSSPEVTLGTLTKTSGSGLASGRFDLFIGVINTAIEFYDIQNETGIVKPKQEMEDDLAKKQKIVNKLHLRIEKAQQKIQEIQSNKKRTENDFAILKSVTEKEKTNVNSYNQIIEEIKEQIQEKDSELQQAYIKLSTEKQIADNIKLAIRRILNYETQQDMFDNPPEELKQINDQKDIQQLQNELKAAQQELSYAKSYYQQMEQQLKEKQLQLQVRNYSVNKTGILI